MAWVRYSGKNHRNQSWQLAEVMIKVVEVCIKVNTSCSENNVNIFRSVNSMVSDILYVCIAINQEWYVVKINFPLHPIASLTQLASSHWFVDFLREWCVIVQKEFSLRIITLWCFAFIILFYWSAFCMSQSVFQQRAHPQSLNRGSHVQWWKSNICLRT